MIRWGWKKKYMINWIQSWNSNLCISWILILIQCWRPKFWELSKLYYFKAIRMLSATEHSIKTGQTLIDFHKQQKQEKIEIVFFSKSRGPFTSQYKWIWIFFLISNPMQNIESKMKISMSSSMAISNLYHSIKGCHHRFFSSFLLLSSSLNAFAFVSNR